MVLPVYLYGHPVIRKETEEIDASYPQLKELIENMYETMYEANGVGLAAPRRYRVGSSADRTFYPVDRYRRKSYGRVFSRMRRCEADLDKSGSRSIGGRVEGDPGGGLSQSARYSRTGSPYRENPVEVAR